MFEATTITSKKRRRNNFKKRKKKALFLKIKTIKKTITSMRAVFFILYKKTKQTIF